MNNTQNIIIDDGLKHFKLSNNEGEVFAELAFNPADTSIIERYDSVVDAFNEIKLKGDTPEERKAFIQAVSNKFKEQFDYLLNRDNSDALFKVYSPVTVFGNGDFFAEVLLRQTAKIIEQEYNVRLQKRAKRIEKYTKKYRK